MAVLLPLALAAIVLMLVGGSAIDGTGFGRSIRSVFARSRAPVIGADRSSSPAIPKAMVAALPDPAVDPDALAAGVRGTATATRPSAVTEVRARPWAGRSDRRYGRYHWSRMRRRDLAVEPSDSLQRALDEDAVATRQLNAQSLRATLASSSPAGAR